MSRLFCSIVDQPCDMSPDKIGQCGSCELARRWNEDAIENYSGSNPVHTDNGEHLETSWVASDGKPAGHFDIYRGEVGRPDFSVPVNYDLANLS